jgi:elongation factor Tu
MATDPLFRMTVQDVFSIRGRGTVVTGQIESGTLKVGDEISFRRQGSFKKTMVTGIEAFRKQLQQAQAGDNVGVLLRDINKPDIQRGDVLVGSDAEFSWNS